MGKIDKNYTSPQRLSVGFNAHIDSLDGKLLNKEEFIKLWKEKFNEWHESNPKL